MDGRQIKSFEDLDVWKYCRQLRKKIETLVKSFPTEEKYKLTDQFIRAARSSHDNIAEGFGRFYYSEKIQFCRISRGSLYEVLNHLYTALDNNYINQSTFNYFKSECQSGIRLINGYIRYLKLQKESDDD